MFLQKLFSLPYIFLASLNLIKESTVPYLYVSLMVAMGCGMGLYMELKPPLRGNRAGGAGGDAGASLLWLRNFSSRRHFARRLENQTC